MAVEIRCTEKDDNLILVNGKEVIKDMDGDWKTKPNQQLSMIEAKFCGEFLGTLQRAKSGSKLRAIYKV